MELEIWTELEAKKEPTRVRLVKVPGGAIQVCVVDVKGQPVEDGTIASISQHGHRKWHGLDPDLGFPLDEEGRIRDV